MPVAAFFAPATRVSADPRLVDLVSLALLLLCFAVVLLAVKALDRV